MIDTHLDTSAQLILALLHFQRRALFARLIVGLERLRGVPSHLHIASLARESKRHAHQQARCAVACGQFELGAVDGGDVAHDGQAQARAIGVARQ